MASTRADITHNGLSSAIRNSNGNGPTMNNYDHSHSHGGGHGNGHSHDNGRTTATSSSIVPPLPLHMTTKQQSNDHISDYDDDYNGESKAPANANAISSKPTVSVPAAAIPMAFMDDHIGGTTLSNGEPYRISSSSASLLNNLSNMIQSTYGHSLNGTPHTHGDGHSIDDDEPDGVVGESRSLSNAMSSLSMHNNNNGYDDAHDESFDMEAERLLITTIDRKSLALQRRGHHMASLELLEQGLVSRRRVYGIDSIEVLDASERVALMYNSIAMSLLYQADYERSLDLLRRADLLTSGNAALVSVRVQTLNNLACCYRRMKKPRTALNLLRESLAIISSESGLDGRAVTHLNMCAILSQLNRHAEALEHANAAVIHCQKQLLSTSLKDQLMTHHDQHALLTEKIVVLGIAYHNLGVEEEFLQHFDRCLQWYNKALQLARDHLGPDEDITRTFEESYLSAKKQVGRQATLSSSSSSPSTSRASSTTATTRVTTSGNGNGHSTRNGHTSGTSGPVTPSGRQSSVPSSARSLSRSASLSSSTRRAAR